MADVLYLNRPGLEADIKKMKDGLEAFEEAVKIINAGVDAAPNDWKGATQTAYMDRYNELRTALTKDVPESVQGMIEFMEKFLSNMMEGDESGASGLR
jgi:uncharacterized protein YukE